MPLKEPLKVPRGWQKIYKGALIHNSICRLKNGIAFKLFPPCR